jgi:aryl-alcohol dehydrogenase-like predicted oxidoreductase
MQYVSLEGVQLSRTGLGTWAMGGNGYLASLGKQSDADSREVITAAISAGVNWIDTAPYYGLGHAEELVGKAVRRLPARDRPMIFTKCGVAWGDPNQPSWEVSTPAAIRGECEASLRRLGVSELDLLQIHWPDHDTPIEDTWGAMAELAAAGLTRWIGVSNFNVALLDRCEVIRHVDTLQPPFSMLRRSAAEQLIPWCVAHRTAVLAYSPLETGMLAGSFTRERVAALLPADVRLERAEVFAEPQLSRCLDLVDHLTELAAKLGRSLAELASGWVLSWPGVSAAIVGARTAEQLTSWSALGSCPLPGDVMREIARLLEVTAAGAGPVHP